MGFGHRLVVVCMGLTLAAALASADVPHRARAGSPHALRSLGGPNVFSRQPLATRADLQAFFLAERAAVEQALALGHWPGDAADLFAAVAGGGVEEVEVPVGGRLEWMALRRGGKNVEVARDLEWQGKRPFPAFRVRFVSDKVRWTFVVPKACGNLSLQSSVGPAELSVVVTSGVLQLTDPEGGDLVVRAGETGTVSAPEPTARRQSPVAAVNVPTAVEVTEGVVSFKEYGRPVSVEVAGGNLVSALLTPDGSMALATPEGNPGPLPVQIGDATGTLSAGGGLAVAWPAPQCVLAVRKLGECLPAEVEVDARATSVRYGKVAQVEVAVERPDGSTEPLGAPDLAGQFLWRRSFDQPGVYRFSAVASSSLDRRSTNSCSGEVELAPCPPPPPPTARLEVTPARARRFEPVHLDATGCRSEGGTVARVLVTVKTAGGLTLETLELGPVFAGDYALGGESAYLFEAVAVDDRGRRSETPAQARVSASPQISYTGSIFSGFDRRRPDQAVEVADGWLGGLEAGATLQVSRGTEIGLSAGVAYAEAPGEVEAIADLEMLFSSGGGYFGFGVGMWGIGREGSPGGNLLLDLGHQLPWRPGGLRLDLYGEARAFLDDLDDVEDNCLLLVGLRLRR